MREAAFCGGLVECISSCVDTRVVASHARRVPSRPAVRADHAHQGATYVAVLEDVGGDALDASSVKRARTRDLPEGWMPA